MVGVGFVTAGTGDDGTGDRGGEAHGLLQRVSARLVLPAKLSKAAPAPGEGQEQHLRRDVLAIRRENNRD